jgi:hypothetical protein
MLRYTYIACLVKCQVPFYYLQTKNSNWTLSTTDSVSALSAVRISSSSRNSHCNGNSRATLCKTMVKWRLKLIRCSAKETFYPTYKTIFQIDMTTSEIRWLQAQGYKHHGAGVGRTRPHPASASRDSDFLPPCSTDFTLTTQLILQTRATHIYRLPSTYVAMLAPNKIISKYESYTPLSCHGLAELSNLYQTPTLEIAPVSQNAKLRY